jgi:Zn-dependent M28 family amino/carboxypeptidase
MTLLLLLAVALADPSPLRLGGASLAPETVRSVVASIEPGRLAVEVAHLSDDSFYGRFYRSPFAFKAAEWIRDRFREAGLKPGMPPAAEGGEASWFQSLEDPEAAPNVVAVLAGRSDRTVLVTAHYDHLPPRRRGEDRIYNGADDNASGVCGMIAVARAIAALPQPPACRVVFVAFTGEEAGLLGAKRFVASLPMPKEQILAVLNLDMISRGEANTIFIDGAAISEPIREALRAANAAIGLNIRFDEHPEWLDRSDQGPFLAAGIPAVLFSVEDHEDYHQVTDHADRIIPELAAKVSRLVALTTLLMGERAAAAPAASGPAKDAPQPTPTPAESSPAPPSPSPTPATAPSPAESPNISLRERGAEVLRPIRLSRTRLLAGTAASTAA